MRWIYEPEIDFATIKATPDTFVWWHEEGIEKITFDSPEEAAINAAQVAKKHFEEDKKLHMVYGGPGRSVVDVAFWKLTGYKECRVAICEIFGYLDVWAHVYNTVADAYGRHMSYLYRLRQDYNEYRRDETEYAVAREHWYSEFYEKKD